MKERKENHLSNVRHTVQFLYFLLIGKRWQFIEMIIIIINANEFWI